MEARSLFSEIAGIPVVMHGEGAFEPDELRAAAAEHARFLFLKDSLRILDLPEFTSAIAQVVQGAWFFARPSCYLAVYTAATLIPALATAPAGGDKEQSIIWESRLHDLLDYPAIWPGVADRNALRIEAVNGRTELVIGNAVVEKLKGTARCRRCPHVDGVCTHFARRLDAAHATRLHRVEQRR